MKTISLLNKSFSYYLLAFLGNRKIVNSVVSMRGRTSLFITNTFDFNAKNKYKSFNIFVDILVLYIFFRFIEYIFSQIECYGNIKPIPLFKQLFLNIRFSVKIVKSFLLYAIKYCEK